MVGLGGPQQPRPLRALGHYLDQLDGADPPVPAQRRILAALGPRKLALARERAAGAVPLLVDAAYTARPGRCWVRTGAGHPAAGRCSTRMRPGPASWPAGTLGFLARVGGYRAQWARLGFTEPEIDGLADRLVDELVAWGEPAVIIDRMRGHRAAGADQVSLSVLSDGGPRPEPPLAVADRLLAPDCGTAPPGWAAAIGLRAGWSGRCRPGGAGRTGEQPALRDPADLLRAGADLGQHVVGGQHAGRRGALHQPGQERGAHEVAGQPQPGRRPEHARPVAGAAGRERRRGGLQPLLLVHAPARRSVSGHSAASSARIRAVAASASGAAQA